MGFGVSLIVNFFTSSTACSLGGGNFSFFFFGFSPSFAFADFSCPFSLASIAFFCAAGSDHFFAGPNEASLSIATARDFKAAPLSRLAPTSSNSMAIEAIEIPSMRSSDAPCARSLRDANTSAGIFPSFLKPGRTTRSTKAMLSSTSHACFPPRRPAFLPLFARYFEAADASKKGESSQISTTMPFTCSFPPSTTFRSTPAL
mmetsp:Transcript_42897/g.110700  ORF Transcript_42897/g.110700 Transcript_42897/m.110700 type:complete len:202 (+) Transcript_42897:1137-1742(+)